MLIHNIDLTAGVYFNFYNILGAPPRRPKREFPFNGASDAAAVLRPAVLETAHGYCVALAPLALPELQMLWFSRMVVCKPSKCSPIFCSSQLANTYNVR